MLLDYLRYVIRLDLAVPDAFGIDQDGHADRAKTYRATVRQDDFAQGIPSLRFFALTQTFLFEDPDKLLLYLSAAHLGTRLSVTYENVSLDRGNHYRCELFELLAVVYEFWL